MVNTSPPASSAEVKQWLEWAGSQLLAMGIPSPAPRGPHSSWPTFAPESALAYGYTGERLRPEPPNSIQIELMDKLLAFPNLISDVTSRRIVNARALVTPISHRYMFSWTKIAFMLHMNKRRVVVLHGNGIREIIRALPIEKVDAIRIVMPQLAN